MDSVTQRQVSHLLDWKYEEGQKYFLVVWKDSDEQTWMPRDNIWNSYASLIMTIEAGEEKVKQQEECEIGNVLLKQTEKPKADSSNEVENCTPEVLRACGLHRAIKTTEGVRGDSGTFPQETFNKGPTLADKTEGSNDVFVVECIMDYKKAGKTELFLVKWANFPLEAATWEPLENMLPDCENLVKTARLLYSKYTPKKGGHKNPLMEKLRSFTRNPDIEPRYGGVGYYPDSRQVQERKARAERRKREI